MAEFQSTTLKKTMGTPKSDRVVGFENAAKSFKKGVDSSLTNGAARNIGPGGGTPAGKKGSGGTMDGTVKKLANNKKTATDSQFVDASK